MAETRCDALENYARTRSQLDLWWTPCSAARLRRRRLCRRGVELFPRDVTVLVRVSRRPVRLHVQLLALLGGMLAEVRLDLAAAQLAILVHVDTSKRLERILWLLDAHHRHVKSEGGAARNLRISK